MIQSSFTSFADPAIVNEFFNFNLSCITSWFECKEPKDISPDAWRIYTREREEQEKTPIPPDAKSWKRCDTPVEMLGRDYRFALLTEVVSVKTSPDSGLTRYVVTLRGLKSLKNRAPYKAGILKEPLIGWSDTTLPGGIRISDIKPGSRMILLFNDPFDAPDLVLTNADYCSYVPNTDANEAAIQRGIERDKLADVP
ncbi:MAG TPA: hypothetical protein VL986_13560 [Terracidiphilus sp.]|nr:hypothetical protein [Terracidiphilus sp.]